MNRQVIIALHSKRVLVGGKDNETIIYGFEGFCRKLKMIIMCEENSRREYEISVGDAFETDCNKLEKWDCYNQ